MKTPRARYAIQINYRQPLRNLAFGLTKSAFPAHSAADRCTWLLGVAVRCGPLWLPLTKGNP